MRIGITGLLGSGKTLLLTIMVYIADHYGMKTVTNYWTTFSEKIHHSLIDKFRLKDCMLGADEINTMIDNRRHPSKNLAKTYAFLQSRKTHMEVRYTTQIMTMIDGRLLNVTDMYVYCRPRKKNSRLPFHYTFKIPYLPVEPRVWEIPYETASKFFDKFNTDEVILPVDLVHEDNVKWTDILENYEELKESKNAFVVYLKRKYPMLTGEVLKGLFDLLKMNKDQKAEELLYGI